LNFTGQVGQDLVNILLEAHVEHPVDFVHHKALQIVSVKRGCFIHMLQQAARCRDDDIHGLNVHLFFLQAFSTNDQRS
jgi:hypothetical protein